MTDPIILTPTPRGFYRGQFVDLYGAECSIQESSLATEAAIWLGSGIDRMHLSQDMVRALLPHLWQFAATGALDLPEALRADGPTDLLQEAAALFREYEGHHRAKAEEAGRPEKAERNADIATRIEAFLAAIGVSE